MEQINEKRQEVQRQLYFLGKNYLEVAARLNELGIKGRRRTAQACPIACFLKKLGCGDLSVGTRRASFYEEPLRCSGRPPTVIDFEDPIEEFISAFDDGIFPELVEE